MNEEFAYLSISLKKIEGTENEYEQILRLNECFKTLPKGKLKQVEDLVSKLVEDVKGVIRQEEPKCEQPSTKKQLYNSTTPAKTILK